MIHVLYYVWSEKQIIVWMILRNVCNAFIFHLQKLDRSEYNFGNSTWSSYWLVDSTNKFYKLSILLTSFCASCMHWCVTKDSRSWHWQRLRLITWWQDVVEPIKEWIRYWRIPKLHIIYWMLVDFPFLVNLIRRNAIDVAFCLPPNSRGTNNLPSHFNDVVIWLPNSQYIHMHVLEKQLTMEAKWPENYLVVLLPTKY